MAYFSSPPAIAVFVALGIVAIVFGAIAYALRAKEGRIRDIYHGADGRASTSKFQFLVWSVVTLFAFAAVFVRNAIKPDGLGPVEQLTIPPFLFMAMGLSAGTAIVAKAITTTKVGSGTISKTTRSPKDSGLEDLVVNDAGYPDLSKVQLIGWTIIGVIVFLYRLGLQLKTNAPQLPDIDEALLVLMGLGQGAYLGQKLTVSSVPRIVASGASRDGATMKITLAGSALGGDDAGTRPDGGQIVANTHVLSSAKVTSWTDKTVVFELPPSGLDGLEWKAGQVIQFNVVVGGQQSDPTSVTIPP